MIAFKVVYPDGREFIIHEEGRVEGFEPGGIVVNHIPLLIQQAVCELEQWRPFLPADWRSQSA